MDYVSSALTLADSIFGHSVVLALSLLLIAFLVGWFGRGFQRQLTDLSVSFRAHERTEAIERAKNAADHGVILDALKIDRATIADARTQAIKTLESATSG